RLPFHGCGEGPTPRAGPFQRTQAARLLLRRRADINVLAIFDLEDRDDLVLEVAVLVERDRALEGLEAGLKHVVLNVLARERLAILAEAADRVLEDENAVVGGQGVGHRSTIVLRLVLPDPILRRRVLDRIR